MSIYAKIVEENKDVLRGKKSLFENAIVLNKLKDEAEKHKDHLTFIKSTDKIT